LHATSNNNNEKNNNNHNNNDKDNWYKSIASKNDKNNKHEVRVEAQWEEAHLNLKEDRNYIF